VLIFNFHVCTSAFIINYRADVYVLSVTILFLRRSMMWQ